MKCGSFRIVSPLKGWPGLALFVLGRVGLFGRRLLPTSQGLPVLLAGYGVVKLPPLVGKDIVNGFGQGAGCRKKEFGSSVWGSVRSFWELLGPANAGGNQWVLATLDRCSRGFWRLWLAAWDHESGVRIETCHMANCT